jgi:hypothetical protein
LSTTNFTWTHLWSNLGMPSEKSDTGFLRHDGPLIANICALEVGG